MWDAPAACSKSRPLYAKHLMLWTHVAVCRGRHAESPARTQAEAARLFKQVKDAYEVLSDGAPHSLCTLLLL